MADTSERKKRVPGTRVLRDGTYEAILVVPADCVALVGKKNLTRRLGTKRFSEAAKWAPPVLKEFDAIVEAARAGASSPAEPVDPRKAIRAVDRWRLDELARAELRAFNQPDEEIPDAGTNWKAHLAFRVRYHELRDGLSRRHGWEDMPGFDDKLIDALKDQGITLSTDHPAMTRLRPIFQAAWYDVVKYEDDLRGGIVAPGETPPPTTRAPTTALTTTPPNDGPTILETFGFWKAEHVNARGAKKTIDEFETQVRRFVDFCGNKRVSEVTKRDIIAFKDAMMNYPARCPPELVGKGIRRITEWGADNADVPKLAPKTMNEKVLAALRAVFGCALARDDIETNPVHGVRVKSFAQHTKPRPPYSADELKCLFSGPVFIDRHRPVGGAGEAAKWIPLLALLTGARLEEIAIIELDDIKESAGISYIHFKTLNDDGTPRRVKNLFARRKVPIHSELIELGFLQYVKQQRKRKLDRLFPEVRSERDQKAAAFGQWYGRYARKFVPDTDKTFHSFRHTFKRATREGRVEKTLRDAVMGHSHQDESEQYGVDEDGQGFSLERLREAVEAVRYPSIDFTKIR